MARDRLRDYLNPEGSKRKDNAAARNAVLAAVILMTVGGAMGGAVLLLTTTIEFGNRGTQVVDEATLRTGALVLEDALLQVDDEGSQTLLLLVEPVHGQKVEVDKLWFRVSVRGGEATFRHGPSDQANTFSLKVIRDKDGSMDDGVADDTDLLELRIPISKAGVQFANRDAATLDQVAPFDGGTELVASYTLQGPRSVGPGVHRLTYT